MRTPLTDAHIDAYTRIDDHGKTLLCGFMRNFPDCTIEWISREESERRKESAIPAYGTESDSTTPLKPQIQKQQSRRSVTAQPRLFETKEKANVESHDSTN